MSGPITKAEFDKLAPAQQRRRLRLIFEDRQNAARPYTPDPFTPTDQVVDVPEKRAAAGALGHFCAPIPRRGDSRALADALEALAAAELATGANPFAPPAPPPIEAGPGLADARRAPLSVHTRVELPPADKSLDVRELRAHVRNAMRGLYRRNSNLRKCGERRYRGAVEARVRQVDGDDRGGVTGVVRCGNVHACVKCAPRISSTRAEMVRAIVSAHREKTRTAAAPEGAVYMGTLTVPHTDRMRCKRLSHHIAKAHRVMLQGSPWRRWKERIGFVGSIRSSETTHGDNGWHPHMHVLYATARPLTDAERLAAEDELYAMWCSALDRVPGFRIKKPSRERGVRLDASYSDDYIAKLGLADELTGALHKVARKGGRTPFQIMADYARTKSDRDRQLLREYIAAKKGARQLTWSRGKKGAEDLRVVYLRALVHAMRGRLPKELAERYGDEVLRYARELVPEQTDLAFYTDVEQLQAELEDGALVATIAGRQWDALVRVMRAAGSDAEYFLTLAAEQHGAVGVEAAIAAALDLGKQWLDRRPNLARWLRWLEAPPPPAGPQPGDQIYALSTSRVRPQPELQRACHGARG